MQSWGRFFGIGAASAPDTARRARCTSRCSRRRCPRRSRRARCGQPRRSIPRDRTCSRSWRRRRGRTPQGHQGFSWNRKAPSLPLNHARSLTVADPTFREQAGSPLVVGRKIVSGPSLVYGFYRRGDGTWLERDRDRPMDSRSEPTGISVRRASRPRHCCRRIGRSSGASQHRSRTVQARGAIRVDISTIRNVRATSLGNLAVRFDVEHFSRWQSPLRHLRDDRQGSWLAGPRTAEPSLRS